MKEQILKIWAVRRVRLAVVTLAAALLVALGAGAIIQAQTIPTISIAAVEAGKSVTITTHHYPANQTFTVRMGAAGTRGIDGTVVGSLTSEAGGSITATFLIPEALQGAEQVSIRLESPAGYYSYNWFYNNTATVAAGSDDSADSGDGTGSTGTSYNGIPTFGIMSVEADATVTVKTRNFPPNRDFRVMMGVMGTRGINGTAVATTNSGDGGEFSATYDIPDGLKGANRIAIRMESSDGYYAFNWFYNNTAGSDEPVTKPPVADPPPSGYSGFPTFSIQAVTRNTSVTIVTDNLPPEREFKVTMGGMGTRGVNGVVVATTNSGEGGAQSFTYNIPAELAGAYRIAIRMESADGYHAFNWFYNNSTN